MQRTLVLLKPDAVQRALAGEIIARIERKGLKIAGMKLMHIGEDLAREHYGEHVGKPFFEGLVEYITSSPVVAMAVEGENAGGGGATPPGPDESAGRAPWHDQG